MESVKHGERIEKVRAYVDEVLLQMTDAAERRCAYVHLYGVAQACAMIAQKRNTDAELAIVAGMLHDLYAYKTMDHCDHAHKGASMAKEILSALGLFNRIENEMICEAIYRHSDKAESHPALVETLVDADVWQHCLYNPYVPVSDAKKARFERLKKEFGL